MKKFVFAFTVLVLVALFMFSFLAAFVLKKLSEVVTVIFKRRD